MEGARRKKERLEIYSSEHQEECFKLRISSVWGREAYEGEKTLNTFIF